MFYDGGERDQLSAPVIQLREWSDVGGLAPQLTALHKDLQKLCFKRNHMSLNLSSCLQENTDSKKLRKYCNLLQTFLARMFVALVTSEGGKKFVNKNKNIQTN